MLKRGTTYTPSFSSSSVYDAAARAAADLACLVTSDRRPRLAAPEPSAEAGGADVLAAASVTARTGGSGPVMLAAGGDAGIVPRQPPVPAPAPAPAAYAVSRLT